MPTNIKLTEVNQSAIRTLIYIALPLIITSCSDNLMIFFDRLIIAHYSDSAFNIISLASQAVEIFQFAIWAMAGLTEVFVASLAAKRMYNQMAVPCWQMIYLSLFSLPIVWLLGKFTPQFIFHGAYQQSGISYYLIMLYSIPLLGMVAALSGFFIGLRKLSVVVVSTVIINLINLALDFILIFGWEPFIPAMGLRGAAYSTIIALSLQVVWLLIVFLNYENRFFYHTHKAWFNLAEFVKNFKIGSPIAVSHAVEMVGWLVIMKLLASTDLQSFTLISLGNSLYLLFSFFSDGLYRALSSLGSYYISLSQYNMVRKFMRLSGFLMCLLLFLLLMFILFFPHFILIAFNLKDIFIQHFEVFKFNLWFIWLAFVLMASNCIFSAILTACHKTQFLMFANILAMWLIAILPIFCLIHFHLFKTEYIWPLIDAYLLIYGSLLIYKYFNKKRKHSTV